MSSHAKISPEAAKALGRRLQALRADFGWTQAEVADFAGMSRQQYRTLELGYRDNDAARITPNPTVASLLALARVFKVDAKDLISVMQSEDS
ncbi:MULTISPECIES: helix-turn-helix transcriptional regulator [Arthrobacter]|uniref:Helix-turn-helix transcriptional regulator n=2 Tax=Arthrobacter TaxID=1663 RepID=A0ABU9KJT8_9MICC|nr:helix-turn-helix transcriptional regulator [Arthrobacter sp. YJM1]MDP5226537.1 helix-turn-helix transcriptional regulator [Arthrobacter sp. YJM1]